MKVFQDKPISQVPAMGGISGKDYFLKTLWMSA